MADKRRPPDHLGKTEPSLPTWQSAARPGPAARPSAKPAKVRGTGPGEPDNPAFSRQRAPLRSKPLKLASKRKRGASDLVVGAVRACVVTILLLCSLLLAGSAPVGPLPNVETRFEDWKQTRNESALDPLPRRDEGP